MVSFLQQFLLNVTILSLKMSEKRIRKIYIKYFSKMLIKIMNTLGEKKTKLCY